ncbi:hypothetical protein KC19_9G026100 [Ceratodon purpureus]|uniref:Endoplasmic reticulum transmembrane protein n=1 Tax=Ceratodon purpureus TaxID=3225 RepID=A0A8T0GN24_CERPU|nr:hypothetical protein KC19_9G026100 [Ceratodon purpureus]
MLPLLVAAAGAEAVVAFLLASRVTPLVEGGNAVVEVCRRNKAARVLVKTATGAFVVRLASDVSSALRLQRRVAVADQLLAQTQLLEIALICFVLILELAVNSLYLSLKRAAGLKQEVDSLKKQLKGAQAAYVKLQDEVSLKAAKEENRLAVEVKSQKEIIFDLRQKLEQAQVDANSKEKELKSATTNLKALEKQTGGFQDEYMRVLDDNENLRNQLSLFDRKNASSGNKKNS